MPGGDGTGPIGMGPRTGRGLGICNGYNSPGFANRGFGGRTFGRGRGFRRMFFAENYLSNREVSDYPVHPSKEQEKQNLENETKVLVAKENALKQEIESIKKRLDQLRKQE